MAITNPTKLARKRRGTATAELAVCLPALLFLVLGSVELCNYVHLKQAVSSTAYEAAREAIRRGSTTESFNATAESILEGRRATASKLDLITISATPSIDVPRGDLVTVTVSTPSSLNAIFAPQFINGTTSVSVTMAKE